MRSGARTMLVASAVLSLGSCAVNEDLASEEGAVSRQDVLVRRTAHGIPHIRAADYRGLGFGAGYALAEDNLCLFADTVVTLTGERSRWFGADASTESDVNNLASDVYHQWLNQSGVLERLLAQPAPRGPTREARGLVQGYAAGYNRYLAETSAAHLPDEACRGAQWVRPITEIDIWRRVHKVAAAGDDFIAAIAGAQPPGAEATTGAAAPSAEDLARLRRRDDTGSNGYGLGRRATAGGTGMLLANPHVSWRGEGRFYQMQLTIDGEIDVSGAAFIGLPMIGIGHNHRLAWTHTAATAQAFTLTQLTLTPGDPLSYVVDGEVRAMERDSVTVTVREPDGDLVPVHRTIYRTPDGPLFEFPGLLDWSASTAYVWHDANATNLRTVDQWLAMARARDVRELHAAQARLLGVPLHNTIAADVTGIAYYGDVQVVPHVTDELLARCAAGPDIGPTILDGSRGDCSWGSDPDAIEPGLLGPSRLPALFRSDQVSNMNDSPWLSNPAAPLTRYPAIVGDVGTERSPRTRMGLDMIADRLDGSDGLGPAGFTLASLQATMLGNRNLTAEQGRAAIVARCAAEPTLTATDGRSVDVSAACRALAGWNGRGDLGARGAILWRKLIERIDEEGVNLWRVPFDPADPTRTPRDFDASSPAVGQAFADTVQEFQAADAPVNVRLGAFQRHADVPIHGCDSDEGCFNQTSVDTTLRPGGETSDVDHGSCFIMAVELTAAGPRARTILTYGQSANQASPYYRDQTRLYSAKRWVSGRFTEAEIAGDPSLTVQRLTE